jgi:hypothetical protein
MNDDELRLKYFRIIAKAENADPMSGDKDMYNAALEMYDKGEVDLREMLATVKEYRRAKFRHAGNPDVADPLFDGPPLLKKKNFEYPSKFVDEPEYTGEYPAMNEKVSIRVGKLIVLLLITGVIGYAIGSPEGFARLLESVWFLIYYGFLVPSILSPVGLILSVGFGVALVAVGLWKLVKIVRDWILK